MVADTYEIAAIFIFLTYMIAVAIRTGTVRRVWFAIRTAMEIFLAIVGEIFVFFDFYNLTLINQQ